MDDGRWWKDFDAVVAATVPAGSRILDVGCGDGGLVDRLVELGLFVNEFAWDAYDERAAAWLADHDPSDKDNSIAAWWREHDELRTSATIQQALSAAFAPTLEVGRPYFARMLGRPDLEAEEHALIDAQLLPALGCWYIARRR